MNKKLLMIFLMIFIVTSVGWYIKGGKDLAVNKALPAQGISVSILNLSEQNITLKEILPGRVTPHKQAEIRPQVSGIIIQRLFEEGADVEKGQQLYQIDDKSYHAVLASKQADLISARANVKSVKAKTARYKNLVKINAISKQEYDDVIAQLDQARAAILVAQAAIDIAQINMDYTKMYAPIAGRIGKSVVTEGSLVTSNQTQSLATITQLDPVYLDMNQPGVEAMRLQNLISKKNKIPVRVIIDSMNRIFHSQVGVLEFSDVSIDQTTGSFALRAIIPNPDYTLLPGLFVHAELDIGEQNVLLIPQRATVRGTDGRLSVWVVSKDNKATSRAVVVGSAYKDQWIVKSGLSIGEDIVVEGYQKLSPNAVVVPSLWNDGLKKSQ